MKKKLLACMLSATIVACQSGLFVGADYMPKAKCTGNLIKLEGEKIDEYVKNVALGWANNTNPELKLKATDVKKVMQINSSDPEYAVSFYSGKTPYGYAVVLFKDNEATVKESVVEKNEKSVYDNLIDVVEDEKGTSEKKLDIGKKVLELAPMQYGIVADYKSEKSNPINSNIYDVYGNEIPAVQVAEENVHNYCDTYNNKHSIFISEKNWKEKYTRIKTCNLKMYNEKKSLISEDDIEKVANKYCCVVQSLLQISAMEGIIGNDFKNINKPNNSKYRNEVIKAYNKLWKYCKTDVVGRIGLSNPCLLGSSNLYDASAAFTKFAKEKGYKRTLLNKVVSDPSSNWITTCIGQNRPITMGYMIKTKEGDINHAISILGIYKAKKNSTGKKYTYLKVHDGWGSVPRYINYTTVDFSEYCQAVCFDVRK